MQVNLTEEDLRAIWRDIYIRTFTASEHLAEGAHKDAAGEADAAVALLRTDRKAIDDAIAAEVAARPPAEWARTVDDERRDVVAYLVESARCRQVTDYDSGVIAEGRHVGAVGVYGPGREVLPIESQRDAKIVTSNRTAEDELRDVLAFISAEIGRHDEQAEKHMSAAARERCSARAEILRTVSAYIERGDHVGAADRTEVKP